MVYLGYDDKNLYVIFVAFDSQLQQVRANLTRREAIWDDDLVQIILDTFHDQRRAYFFFCNPLGIQADGIHTEGQGGDTSFDTLWSSEGKLTPQGFVVWMAIPFRSLRFHPSQANWGIILERRIPRLNERHFWPRVSRRVQGLLNQGGEMSGLERISPGRNIQLIPYGVFRWFHALDERDPNAPFFAKKVEGDLGLDAKFVLKDRLVLDFTVNPDFSQVESDEPQNTVNRRFEVFFPEKRPFFLENASFFETPINLLFTRRIADPQFGARLTGKLGRYAVGALFADDQSPGRRVPELAQWAHDGTRLEEFYNINYFFGFRRQSEFGAFANTGRERLRPSDFSTLGANRDYATGHRGFFFYTAYFPQWTMFAEAGWGRGINLGPASGPPVSARSNFVVISATVRPASQLSIENRYILTRLRVVGSDAAVFNDHILRQKWNYQITRELSLRLILQYNATLANQQFSSLSTTKNFNADFLITYLLHPGTALYVGYNSNLQNIDLVPCAATATCSTQVLRTNRFINDARGVFVKFSYLFRF